MVLDRQFLVAGHLRQFLLILLVLFPLGVRAQVMDEPEAPSQDKYLSLLHNADAGERRDAAARLSSFHTPEVVAALLKAVSDDDPTVRAQVVATLGEMDAVAALRAVIAATHDPFEMVATRAVETLGKDQDPEAVTALIALLKDTQFPLRVPVAAALGERGAAIAIPPLLGVLSARDAGLRAAAATALGAIEDEDSGERRVAALGALRHDAVPAVRCAALEALGTIDDDTALPLILLQLHDTNAQVRAAALQAAIDQQECADFFPQAVTALKDPAGEVRRTAIGGLAQAETAPAVDALLLAAHDPDDGVREAVATAITAVLMAMSHHKIAPDAALKAQLKDYCLATLADSVPAVAMSAVPLAVPYVGKAADERLVALLLIAHIPDGDFTTVGKSGMERALFNALPALADAHLINILADKLKSTIGLARGNVLFVLGEINDVQAAEVLAGEIARQQDARMRALLVSLLRAPCTLPVLTAMLKDPAPEVRNSAFAVLAARPDGLSALPPLQDIDPEQRARVAERMAYTQNGIDWLFAAVAAPDNAVAALAEKTLLAGLADSSISPYATQALTRPQARVRLVGALLLARQHDKRGIEALAALLTDGNVHIRLAAALALARSGDGQGAETLAALLDDKDIAIRLTAAEELAGWRDVRAVAPLVTLLTAADPAMVARATIALGQFGDARAQDGLLTLLDEHQPGELPSILTGLVRSGDDAVMRQLAQRLANSVTTTDLRQLSVPLANDYRASISQRYADPYYLNVPRQFPPAPAVDPAFAHALLATWIAEGFPVPAPFAELTRDARPAVRAAALDFLSAMRDPANLPIMLAALRDADAGVRLSAAEALREQPDVRALAPLRDALQDMDARVCDQAAWALGEIGDKRAFLPLMAALRRGVDGAIFPCGQLGDARAMALLLHFALGNGGRGPRMAALTGIRALVEHDGVLSAGERAQCISTLISMLKDPDVNLVRQVLWDLRCFKNPAIVAPLLVTITQWDKADYLSERATELMPEAIGALAVFKDARIIDPLIAVLRHESARGSASESIAGSLQVALRPFADVPRVHQAFKAFGGEDEHEDEGDDDAPPANNVDHRPVAQITAEFAARCIMIDYDSHEIGIAGKQLLSSLKSTPAKTAEIEQGLLSLLNNQWSAVRCAAVAALGGTQDAGMAAPLLPLLHDVSPRVRQATIMALGALPAKGASAELCACLHDRDTDVRLAAATVLGQLGDAAAVDPLLAVLADRDWAVRNQAVIALGLLKDPRAEDALLALLQHPGAGALRWNGSESITRSAALALAAIGDTRAVSPLIAALERGALADRAAAAQALGVLKAQAAVPALQEELLRFGYLSETVDGRKVVVEALRRIAGKDKK